jgi:uncharacterized protein YndB with AHSA1/START domain
MTKKNPRKAQKETAAKAATKPRGRKALAKGKISEILEISVPAPPTKVYEFIWHAPAHRLFWRLSGHRFEKMTLIRLTRPGEDDQLFLVEGRIDHVKVGSRICVSYSQDESDHPRVISIKNVVTGKIWSRPRSKRARR